MGRRLRNWREAFIDYMSGKPSPRIYWEWSALVAISGALERRCVCRELLAGDLYPNLYVMLVGFPGCGKSLSIDPVVHMWRKAEVLRVAPESLSGKGLFDAMADGEVQDKIAQILGKTQDRSATSLLIGLTEFGTFLHEYDHTLISFLNRMYDCGDVLEDQTRGKGLKRIERPHLALLAGTQPGYLAAIFPPIAFEMGLTSRVIMVWGERPEERPKLFGARSRRASPDDLIADLKHIATLQGDFHFDKGAQFVIQDWIDNGMEPVPSHPRLVHYRDRRAVNMMKAAMCISVAEGDDLVVTKEHTIAALELILETEASMPKIFDSMVPSEHRVALHEVQSAMIKLAGEDRELSKQEIMKILLHRLPHRDVYSAWKNLLESGFVREKILGSGLYEIRTH